jgi:hypothetical protein
LFHFLQEFCPKYFSLPKMFSSLRSTSLQKLIPTGQLQLTGFDLQWGVSTGLLHLTGFNHQWGVLTGLLHLTGFNQQWGVPPKFSKTSP